MLIADTAAYLGLSPKSDGPTSSVFVGLPGVVVNVLDMRLEVECNYDLSDMPPSGLINVRSSLQVDFWLIQERCEKFWIDRQSNTEDVF